MEQWVCELQKSEETYLVFIRLYSNCGLRVLKFQNFSECWKDFIPRGWWIVLDGLIKTPEKSPLFKNNVADFPEVGTSSPQGRSIAHEMMLYGSLQHHFCTTL